MLDSIVYFTLGDSLGINAAVVSLPNLPSPDSAKPVPLQVVKKLEQGIVEDLAKLQEPGADSHICHGTMDALIRIGAKRVSHNSSWQYTAVQYSTVQQLASQ